jgi:hypothetical protein
MKKTIHKNYSLLVLVLLILYMTYINLPPDKINNMTGGAIIDPNNPYLGMDENELNEHLIAHSAIYSFMFKYSWVYWTITALLFGIAGYYASTQFGIQGIPILGIEPGISWDEEGRQFINYFYVMSKQKYGLITSEYSSNINSKVMNDFENDFDKFVAKNDGNSRIAIDTFCNAVSPCNICNCAGPDPNYAGTYGNAPKVMFPGIDSGSGKSCVPKSENPGQPSAADAANAVIKMQKSRGIGDLIFGRIPNCCCHLWKALIPNEANFTATGLQNLINTLQTVTDINMSTSNGCQPAKPGDTSPLKGKVNGRDTEIVPYRDANGDNTYVFDMVKACIAKNKLTDLTDFQINTTNNRVSTVSQEFLACKTYDLDLDEGVTAAHVAKNARKYITPSIGRTPSGTSTGTGLNDVSRSWTSGLWNESGGTAPKISIVKPSNWPSVIPFIGRETINSWWYKSSSGIMYELTIYNRLYEISAYPVKVVDNTIYINEFKSTTHPTVVTFLNSYLSEAALSANPNIFMYGGSYYFP